MRCYTLPKAPAAYDLLFWWRGILRVDIGFPVVPSLFVQELR